MRKLLADKGQHQAVEWLDKLRSHVETVGAASALESLTGDNKTGAGKDVTYLAADEGYTLGHFARAYLGRHGITGALGAAVPADKPLVSTNPPLDDWQGRKFARGKSKDDFRVKAPTLDNKLTQSQKLPGLESSADLADIAGEPVTHLNADVVAKLDAKYGPGKWIVKPYSDSARAGHGIFFPQRAQQLQQDAKAALHDADNQLPNWGFRVHRDDKGAVDGIEHKGGDVYKFGSHEYESTIHGAARHWADRAASAAGSERGAELPDGGHQFMAQPAFDVVGVTERDRANGTTIAPGEGRIHIVTRNGKAEIVQGATWVKGESMPVVFETDDTRAMAKAAQEAIAKLPASERKNQIYAPDVVKTADGYRVVEPNPSSRVGTSGYLLDNPLVIDAFVSQLTGREPAHVQFIRKLLSKKASAGT